MNIGIVTTWFERGAAYVSRQFMEVLQKRDTVFIYARGGEKYAKGDPKWDLPNVTWGVRNLAKMRQISMMYIDKKDFKKWIDKNKIEILLFNEQQWWIPLIWCKEWGIKTVAYVDYYNELTIPLFDIYDCLICNTLRHSFAFRKHSNARYLKWGTNVELYKPMNDIHDKITFFNSAGMAPIRKGTDFVIKAFYGCRNRKDAKLLIHTQRPLRNTIPEIMPLVDELLKEGTMEIVEKTVSAPGLYHCADVYVYPSRLDGIGLTLMEAASSGLACITVDNPPMNEFVEDKFGFKCKVEYQYSRNDGYYWPMCSVDLDSLTQIMEEMIAGKIDVEEMKNNARTYALCELDFNKNMMQLSGIFDSITMSSNNNAITAIKEYENMGVKKLKKRLGLLFKVAALIKGESFINR